MNHIFHYHVTGYLALKAGFPPDEAAVIANAALMVDLALVPYAVRVPGRGSPYQSPVTHHFGFWDAAQETAVWLPFHFFPSGSRESARRDRAVNPLRVVPHSPPVKELLVAALKSRDPYRIGIALHTYADTWAHQEFIGRHSEYNALPGVLGIPPVGHAQAERLPDLFQARWRDPRLEEDLVDNRERFMAAAEHVYRYLATYQRRSFGDWGLVALELELALGPRHPGAALESAGSRVQAGLQKGLQGLKCWAGRLGLGAADDGPEPEAGDPRRPESTGAPDAELELNLGRLTGLPPVDRLAWRREALVLDPASERLDAESQSVNDKLSWLKHEIMAKAGYPASAMDARPGFEGSHFFRWCEAAKAHAACAQGILKQL